MKEFLYNKTGQEFPNCELQETKKHKNCFRKSRIQGINQSLSNATGTASVIQLIQFDTDGFLVSVEFNGFLCRLTANA